MLIILTELGFFSFLRKYTVCKEMTKSPYVIRGVSGLDVLPRKSLFFACKKRVCFGEAPGK